MSYIIHKITINAFFILAIISLPCCGDDSGETPSVITAPILLDPGEATTSSFKISWIGSTQAIEYFVDVAKDDAFTDLVTGFNRRTVTGESVQVPNLEDDTKYYIRLKASDGEKESEFSNIKSISTLFEFIPDPEPEIFLREVADFPIGVALQAGRLTGKYASVVADGFSSITGEFEMKMNPIFQAQGSYNFGPGDDLVSFAEANDMQVHGHALIWHNAVPSFVENFSGTDTEFEEMIKTYIKDVLTHYKGKVISWDVVNEAFEDKSGSLRNSVFRRKMGDDYLAKCFQYAREADPDVLLFYNDYNMFFDESKFNAALDMIKDFQERGIPIDGFGFQSHIDIGFPSRSQIQTNVDRIVATGLKVHFSEIDIRINANNDLTMVNASRLQSQKSKYKELGEIFKNIPVEQRFALTVWGLIDSQTWLIDFWNQPEWPLMFNNDFSPKPAHTGLAEGVMD